MAQLTGQAALDYMMANPGKFQVIDSGGMDLSQFQPMEAPRGGILGTLEGIGKSIIDPFVGSFKDVANLGSIYLQPGGYQAAVRGEYNPVFGNPEEFKAQMEDPASWVEKEVKRPAQIASYAIPGGGTFGPGIKGALTSGAISGGLGSFGASKSGEELESTLKGALFGAATGGALQQAGVGIQKLRGLKGGNVSARGDLIEVDPTKLKYSRYKGVTGAKTLQNKTIGVLDDLGLKSSTKGQIAQSIDEGLGTLGSQLDETLANSPATFDSEALLRDFETKFKNNQRLLSKPDAQELMADLIDLGDNPTAKQITDLKFATQRKINWNRTNQNFPNKERVYREFEKTLDKAIKTNPATGTQTADILDRMSTLNESRDFALKSLGKKTYLPGPQRMAGVKLDVGGVAQRGKTGLAGLPGTISDIAKKLPTDFGMVGRVAPTIAGQQAVMPQQPSMEQPTDLGIQQPETNYFDLGTTQPEISQAERSQYFMDLVNSGYSPSEAKTIVEQTMPGEGGRALTASQVEQIVDSENSLAGLNDLEGMITGEYGKYFGPAKGRAGGLAQTLGLADERATVQTATAALAQKIGVAMEGGKVTDADIRRYQQMLPNMNDSKEAALNKLQKIREMISRNYENNLIALQRAGYNPYGGTEDNYNLQYADNQLNDLGLY